MMSWPGCRVIVWPFDGASSVTAGAAIAGAVVTRKGAAATTTVAPKRRSSGMRSYIGAHSARGIAHTGVLQQRIRHEEQTVQETAALCGNFGDPSRRRPKIPLV